jgi:hypothetical protein
MRHADIATALTEEGGLDKLFAATPTPPYTSEHQQALVAQVEGLLGQNEQLKRMYDNIRPPEDKMKYIRSLLEKPGVREAVSKKLADRAGPDKLGTLQGDAHKLQIEIQKLEKERDMLGDGTTPGQIKELEKEIAKIEDELRQFEMYDSDPIRNTTPLREGKHAKHIADRALESADKGDRLAAEHKALIEQQTIYHKQKAALLAKASNNPGVLEALDRVDKELETLQDRLEETDFLLKASQQTSAKAESLKTASEGRRAGLSAKLTEKQEMLEKMKTRQTTVVDELATKKQQREQAVQTKRQNAEALAQSIRNIVPEAVAESMSGELEDLRKTAVDRIETEAVKSVMRRYVDTRGRLTQDFHRDFRETFIASPDGPDVILQKTLGQRDYDILKSNPEQYKTVMKELKEKMIGFRCSEKPWHKIGTKKLSHSEVTKMMNSPELGEEYIKELLGRDEKTKQLFDEAQQKFGRSLGQVLQERGFTGRNLRLALSLGLLGIVLGPSAITAATGIPALATNLNWLTGGAGELGNQAILNAGTGLRNAASALPVPLATSP